MEAKRTRAVAVCAREFETVETLRYSNVFAIGPEAGRHHKNPLGEAKVRFVPIAVRDAEQVETS